MGYIIVYYNPLILGGERLPGKPPSIAYRDVSKEFGDYFVSHCQDETGKWFVVYRENEPPFPSCTDHTVMSSLNVLYDKVVRKMRHV